jgi:hypothetical protein
MSTPHPPSSVKFLLCDDVRSEANGKLSLIGLYPDDKIYVLSSPNVPGQPSAMPGFVAVLNQLAVVCLAFGGVGVFPASAKITGPSGQAFSTMLLGNPTFTHGATSTIALQGGLFPVQSYGRYTCTLTIGAVDFTFGFDILAAPAPTALPPPAAVTAATPSTTTARLRRLSKKTPQKRAGRRGKP